ncbi:MAG TPA: hypothetical protein VEW66_01390 [Thermomicrobiales bacterium]|nr:hypothetical protein [Thermomicrobiales bacterium]
MSSATTYIDVNAPVSDEIRSQIAGADNNALIVRLMFTTNHLSRWLTPIHDPNRLERSLYRGEPTAKDLVIALRNEEQRVYPKLYLIATQPRANLDTLPDWEQSPQTVERDTVQPTIVLLAQFRRLRQSTCGLLRSLPDDAWGLMGRSRREPDVTIRHLAEGLAITDYRYLRALDQTLDQVGARDGLAEIQKTHLDELLTLVPEHLTL